MNAYNNCRVYGTILCFLMFVCVFIGVKFVSKFSPIALFCVIVSILCVYIGVFVANPDRGPRSVSDQQFVINYVSFGYRFLHCSMSVVEETMRSSEFFSTGWRQEERPATKTLYQLPAHRIMYFPSIPVPSPPNPFPVLTRTWDVIKRMWNVLICTERKHRFRTNGAGESSDIWLTLEGWPLHQCTCVFVLHGTNVSTEYLDVIVLQAFLYSYSC